METKITYTKKGDYYIPNLVAPANEYPNYVLGKYGRLRAKYLKENRKVEYSLMLIDGTLRKHLVETDMHCKERIDTLINELKQQENVSEDLKNTDSLAWIGAMNNIKNRAEEIVFNELIYI